MRLGARPGLLRDRFVLRDVLGVPGEALAERQPVDAEPPGDVFLAHVPLARLQELHHRDPPVARDRPHHDAERGGRLALAVAGVHDHDRSRGVGAFGEVMLFGWFDGGHGRLGRTFPGVKVLLARRSDRTHAPPRRPAVPRAATTPARCSATSCRSACRRRRRSAWSTRWPEFGEPRLGARADASAAEVKAERALLKAGAGWLSSGELVHPEEGWSSRPSAASFSVPPDSRSITHTTGPRTRRRARSSHRGVEDRAARGHDVFDDAEPLPSSSPPSARRQVP
jgi:hypothetical protein